MLSDRQNRMLKIIVQEHIRSAETVSSKSICEILDVSSATVRNEMSHLEKAGLLEKTHVSSGRIPSEEGYRYYVDHLLELDKIDGNELAILKNVVSSSLSSKDAVQESLRLISELTNYTVITLGSESKIEKIKEFEVIKLNNNEVLALVVSSSGKIFDKKISLEDNICFEELSFAVNTINELVADTPFSELMKKMEFDVKPVLNNYIDQYNLIMHIVITALQKIGGEDLHFIGKNNLIYHPDFDNPKKIRDFVKKLDAADLKNLVRNQSDNINIRIGSQTQISDDCTLITTKYHLGEEEGTIAILGPKRMKYDKVISYLESFKKMMEDDDGR